MATTTSLDIFETILTGVGLYFANTTIYLMMFSFMLGGFLTIMLILGLWKKR